MIAYGHSPQDVWSYTPRVIAGYLKLADMRVKQDLSINLALNAMAARGEGKDIKKTMEDLGK